MEKKYKNIYICPDMKCEDRERCYHGKLHSPQELYDKGETEEDCSKFAFYENEEDDEPVCPMCVVELINKEDIEL